MTGPYDGVHGFLFLYPDDPTSAAEVIGAIQEYIDKEHGPVFFASEFEGDFSGFVHFSADDLEGLVDFMGDELFDAGVRSDPSTEGSVLTNSLLGHPMGPKRQSPRFCGICRVRTTRKPAAVLAAIAREFDESEPLMGASRVIGTFPLVVELGSDDEEVLGAAIERLRGVSGVADSTQVGMTDTHSGEQASSA